MVKKRGLGKPLDALLAYTSSEVNESSDALQEKLSQLPLGMIQRGKYQPRREIEPQALQDLSDSIRAQGIIQPLIVRPVNGGDKYEILAGERRWRAARLAGLEEVPVIIRHVPDEAAIAISLIENIQRENLNPIEEAYALQRLIDEFGMTHQQVADAVGKSRASVTNLLRLMLLPIEIRNMLEKGKLEMGHARALITLPESVQIDAAQMIIDRSLSVRETENLVRRLQSPKSDTGKMAPDPDIVNLQEKLARQLKLRVAIHCNAKGKGKLVIHYRNLRELDKLLAQFQE